MSSEKPYCEAKQIYPKQVYVDKTLIECHCLEEKVKVKNGTKKIASTAFSSSKVNEVTLPDSVEEIEPHAFFNCQDLHRITFGKNIKTIEKDSFIIMARKTAANPDAYYLDLRVRLPVGCKRRSYFFFLYLPVFSYLRL